MKNVPLTAGALVLAVANILDAQEKPYTQPSEQPASTITPAPEPGTLNSFFNGALPDAIGKSKISLNARLRWEHADQDSLASAADLKASDAITLRTRFGLTSFPLYGFQGMLEGENITVIGPESNFNAAGSNGQPDKTVIADPPTTELNQAWLSYSNWNSTVKGGRQRIVLDNHRFIGDVGWRQNMQTYDAASFENKSLQNTSLFYSYLWRVNRVFGDVEFAPTAVGNQDFQSDSHIINASYGGWKYGKFVGYTYLLDLENASPTSQNNSTATYGASFAGSAPVHDKVKLDYRAEFAWQTDYADNPIPGGYGTEYYNIELGANVKPFVAGGGYEVLGSDNNQGFKTPLATLHAFNGWADVFLVTPGQGLRDIYGFAQVTLPADIPLRFIYHKYDSDSGSADFGQEYDVVISKKLGKYWTALAKYAYYDGKDAPFPPAPAIDVQKFWLQLEFNY
jgi:hypothetical protein